MSTLFSGNRQAYYKHLCGEYHTSSAFALWLAAAPGDDHYRRPGPIRFTGKSEEERPITLEINAIEAND